MNTPVNYQLAKLLKHNDFDELVECLWRFDGSATDTMPNRNSHSFGYSAPTAAQVVMWLYEKYGIWIECLHRGDMGDFTFKISKLKDGWRTEPHYIHESGYESPTQAYEAAIEYCLNFNLS